jgi:hypothetical protein
MTSRPGRTPTGLKAQPLILHRRTRRRRQRRRTPRQGRARTARWSRDPAPGAGRRGGRPRPGWRRSESCPRLVRFRPARDPGRSGRRRRSGPSARSVRLAEVVMGSHPDADQLRRAPVDSPPSPTGAAQDRRQLCNPLAVYTTQSSELLGHRCPFVSRQEAVGPGEECRSAVHGTPPADPGRRCRPAGRRGPCVGRCLGGAADLCQPRHVTSEWTAMSGSSP